MRDEGKSRMTHGLTYPTWQFWVEVVTNNDAPCSSCGLPTGPDAAEDHPGFCCFCAEEDGIGPIHGRNSFAEYGKWVGLLAARKLPVPQQIRIRYEVQP